MPLDEAWSRLQQALSPNPHNPATERLATENALGRVLAQDVVSSVAVPPHDNSAMDGYAIRVADLTTDATGRAAPGTSLPVAQRIAAGQTGAALQAGSCARIFTGAPVPPGADA